MHGLKDRKITMRDLNLNVQELELFESHRSHLLSMIVQHFINEIRIRLQRVGLNFLTASKYEFIYTSCIKPAFVGDQLVRVIYSTPKIINKPTILTISNILYHEISSYNLTEISCKLTDEYGELININNSSFNTSVGLHFKKV